MKIRRWLLLVLLALTPALHAAEVLTPHMVLTPRARPLPLSLTNRPFLAANRTQQPVNLAPLGYVESEYLVRGQAGIYEWTGPPGDAAVRVREANIPYVTRMLVRRPQDPRKASGLVV